MICTEGTRGVGKEEKNVTEKDKSVAFENRKFPFRREFVIDSFTYISRVWCMSSHSDSIDLNRFYRWGLSDVPTILCQVSELSDLCCQL